MKEQLLSTLEKSRSYTLAVAEAMPEENYQSSPAGAAWNFGELMNHISYGIHWWQENYIKDIKTDWAPPAIRENKKEIVTELEKAYAFLQQELKNPGLSAHALYGFHATLDHVTHHRGQAVLHLRCQNIEPPEYTY